MLLAGDKYLEKVSDLIKNGRKIRIAVAFWGAESESLFDGFSGEYLQIICNLSMGGSNPIVIEKLMTMKNAETRQLDQLHAKLVLSDKGLVVGSANMSANGLGFEGADSNGFSELGIYSADSSLLTETTLWFEKKWGEARPICQKDIEMAKVQWKKRRSSRPDFVRNEGEKSSLLKINKSELKDKPIYFVMYRGNVTEDAIEYKDIVAEKCGIDNNKLDVYEDWNEDQLPRQINDIIIQIRVPYRGRVEIFEPQRPLPAFRKKSGKKLDVTEIMKYEDYSSILPFRFIEQDRQDLANPIRKWFQECLNEEFKMENDGLTKPVSEFLEWRDS